jgi:hypothetical protein
MSTSAALTALVVILGVLTLAVLAVLALLAWLAARLVRIERALLADVAQIRDTLKDTLGRVHHVAVQVSDTVDHLSVGARYAGWAAEAASALAWWRRRSSRPPAGSAKSRWVAWAGGASLGVLLWQALFRRRRPPPSRGVSG